MNAEKAEKKKTNVCTCKKLREIQLVDVDCMMWRMARLMELEWVQEIVGVSLVWVSIVSKEHRIAAHRSSHKLRSTVIPLPNAGHWGRAYRTWTILVTFAKNVENCTRMCLCWLRCHFIEKRCEGVNASVCVESSQTSHETHRMYLLVYSTLLAAARENYE